MLKFNDHSFVLQKKETFEFAFNSSMLPPYAESVAQQMAHIASPHICRCSAQIARNPNVNDKADKSDGLDE